MKYFCSECGRQNVWANEEELLGSEDEDYVCLDCAFVFTMPVGGKTTQQESELSALLHKLREAA
jgi:DNA-directed RNA polymerase subunit RPC12/RpoP